MEEYWRLLQTWVDIPSPSGRETEAARFIEGELRRREWRVERIPVGADRFNLFASTGRDPEVLFCTHLDVVPPHIPFQRRGDTFFGRGVLDAKGIAVAMLAAADHLRSRGAEGMGLLFVVGEETDSDGARAAASAMARTRFVVVGEPTENCLARAQKGSLRFFVTTHGKAGHSSQTNGGPSAIHLLATLITRLLEADWPTDEVLGETTLNVGRIGGGVAANVIAPEAWAEGMFRVVTSMTDIERRLQGLVEDRAEVKVTGGTEPQLFLTVPGFPQTVVSFGSDAGYLRPLGEVLMLGPGSIRFAHSDDEQVREEDLKQGTESYARLYRTLLEQTGEKSAV
jgi:acetylornithine deacetylase